MSSSKTASSIILSNTLYQYLRTNANPQEVCDEQ
jgi:hypothetical protein